MYVYEYAYFQTQYKLLERYNSTHIYILQLIN